MTLHFEWFCKTCKISIVVSTLIYLIHVRVRVRIGFLKKPKTNKVSEVNNDHDLIMICLYTIVHKKWQTKNDKAKNSVHLIWGESICIIKVQVRCSYSKVTSCHWFLVKILIDQQFEMEIFSLKKIKDQIW